MTRVTPSVCPATSGHAMTSERWGRRIVHGAVAGGAGGVASTLVLWLAVEPALEWAIFLEDADDEGHSHRIADTMPHEDGALVSRTAQLIGGMVTAVAVGVLLGIVFTVVYTRSRHRLPGATDLGRSLSLAVFAVVAFGLLPALKVPANPPGIGDPDTVKHRTVIYLMTILFGVLLVMACFAATQATQRWTDRAELRWILGAAVASLGGAAILLVAPSVAEEIPATFPASLVWEFRIGSLGSARRSRRHSSICPCAAQSP